MSRLLVAALLLSACVGAGSRALRAAPADADALADGYRSFLDRARTPSAAVDAALAGASGFRRVDPGGAVEPVGPGDRLVFVNQGRSALFVIVGRSPLAAGARLVGAHIDTPSLRLDTTGLTAGTPHGVRAYRYGGTRRHHWIHRPLALVGEVARRGGERVRIALGLDPDEPTFWVGERAPDGSYQVVTGSAGAGDGFVAALHRLAGVDARDLASAELYLVPPERARRVGLDGAFLGAHGQDDRLNSFLAWRALVDLDRVPERTALVWLVDREEIGSTGRTGARSRFLELVIAYLLRAEGAAATEAALHRALGATTALSADTPPCLNPNWSEVHELSHAPVLGGGPAMFPFTGRGGKIGGSGAHAGLIRSVLGEFEAAGVPVQTGELGRVDEGGGGTIAQYLGHRGIDVVDLGACVVAMHSPFELSSVADLWTTYRGFVAWLGAGGAPSTEETSR